MNAKQRINRYTIMKSDRISSMVMQTNEHKTHRIIRNKSSSVY